jgi:hypothetical protein
LIDERETRKDSIRTYLHILIEYYIDIYLTSEAREKIGLSTEFLHNLLEKNGNFKKKLDPFIHADLIIKIM